MSSPDRASSKRAAGNDEPKTGPGVEATAEPTPQEKADFLKAMSKGITPNTEAARKVEAKKKAEPQEGEPETVQILRKISAPEAIVSTPESTEALHFAAMIDKALADGDLERLQPHAQQALIGALCKLYAANSDAGNRYPVVGAQSGVTATDVMVMCGALLKAVDLQVFELGMWQSWSNS